MPAAGRRCNCRAKSRGVQKHRDAGIRWPAEPATRTPRPGEQACGSPSPLHRRPHTVHLRSSTRRRTPQLLPQSVSPSSCGAPRPDRHSSAAIQHIHRYPGAAQPSCRRQSLARFGALLPATASALPPRYCPYPPDTRLLLGHNLRLCAVWPHHHHHHHPPPPLPPVIISPAPTYTAQDREAVRRSTTGR